MAVLNWLQRRKQTMAPVLKAFNSAPQPHAKMAPRDCPLLVLDIETTGLDARRDRMVSIGWLPVRERRIVVAGARYYLIQSPVSVGQSATVHGVLDRDLVDAREISSVLEELLSTYAGYVFAAHHARLEKAFLQAAIQGCWGGKAEMPFIDTMAIEKHRLQRQGLEITQESLRLDNCLRRYGLENPVAQHHALEDAYSCALLLLAQTSHTHFSLGELLRQS